MTGVNVFVLVFDSKQKTTNIQTLGLNTQSLDFFQQFVGEPFTFRAANPVNDQTHANSLQFLNPVQKIDSPESGQKRIAIISI